MSGGLEVLNAVRLRGSKRNAHPALELYRGCLGITAKKMETTIQGVGLEHI